MANVDTDRREVHIVTSEPYSELQVIFAGEYDGFTEAQIKETDPRFSDERRGDKLGCSEKGEVCASPALNLAAREV